MKRFNVNTPSRLTKVLFLGLALISIGCAHSRSGYNGSMILESKPDISIEQGAGRSLSAYETFSFEGAADEGMRTELRSALESKGYRYMASGADFEVTVSAKAVYREMTVEPEVYEVYHPPGTYHPYYHGKPYDPHGTYYYYGHYSKVVRPGYEHSYHEPMVTVSMRDRRGEIWSGSGQAISKTDDMSVANRHVIREVLKHLPGRTQPGM